MDIIKLRETINRRNSLELNDDYALEECWNTLTDILSNSIEETIEFLKTCTEDEFYGIAEVFPEIIKKTQSREIYNTMLSRNESLKNQEYKESNLTDLRFAEEAFIQ
ncbi:MAG: hypothetical protein E7282_03250 [Lachnospiraceae bacterium]|nr:hypothetical protein [Lachnospiraceae bacterium]